MDYKNFPANWFLDIEAYLQSNLTDQKFAAFDADGTLWDTDLGENFFKWQISNCPELALPANPWQHYLNLKAVDPKKAYLWLAQINEGQKFSTVEGWSHIALSTYQQMPLFLEQKRLIELLLKYKVEVFVVTASVAWAVVPGASLFGIQSSHVLGVRTQVKDGLVTGEQEGFITYRAGKVEELLTKTQKKRPFLCSGNSNGDIELLDCATHFKIAVRAASPSQKLFKAEQELADVAQQKKWWQHSFVDR